MLFRSTYTKHKPDCRYRRLIERIKGGGEYAADYNDAGESMVQRMARQKTTLKEAFAAGFERCAKGDRFGKTAEELFEEWWGRGPEGIMLALAEQIGT